MYLKISKIIFLKVIFLKRFKKAKLYFMKKFLKIIKNIFLKGFKKINKVIFFESI